MPTNKPGELNLTRIQGIIDAMTQEERADPDLLTTPRQRRIAAGSGVQPDDVNDFIKQFGQVRRLMKRLTRLSSWE